jgi:hypothetical protein
MNRKERSTSSIVEPFCIYQARSRVDLQTFREALAILQRQVDELDDLKAQHYQEILEHEEEVWDLVQGKVGLG